MAWTTDVVTGLAQYLEDQGVGQFNSTGVAYTASTPAIFFDVVPASPDRAITLTPYDDPPDPTQAEGSLFVQIRVRGTQDPRTAYDLQDAVFNVLQNLPRTVMGGVTVKAIFKRSSGYLGPDSNGRHERSSNYELLVHRPSPHRI